MPSSATYYAHFGPLRRVYRLIGYQPGTVERANEDDAVVKWDDDGRQRLHQTVAQEGLALQQTGQDDDPFGGQFCSGALWSV
jgi:hypothetical protein